MKAAHARLFLWKVNLKVSNKIKAQTFVCAFILSKLISKLFLHRHLSVKL